MAAHRWRPAVAPLGIAALALALWLGPVTPSSAFTGLIVDPSPTHDSDINLFLYYAGEMAGGSVPYRDFMLEYPPLSAPLILLPHAFGGSYAGYRDAFELIVGLALATAAASTLLAARAAGCDRRTQWAAGGLVAIGPLLLGSPFAADRLDVWPVALVSLATLAAARSRLVLAGALAGLGAAVKLWPAAIVVALAALAHRLGAGAASRRVALAFALALAIPFALALAASPAGLADLLSFHADRPLQIEAVGATGLLVLDQLGIGGPYAAVGSPESGSVNLSGAPADAVAAIASLLGAALALGLLVAGARAVLRTAEDGDAFAIGMRATLAAVLALIVLGKVLSPQYVLWLLPLALLVGGNLRWLTGGLVAVSLALTNLAFAHHAAYQTDQQPLAIALYGARSLALVVLLALLSASLLGSAPTSRQSPRRLGANARSRQPAPRSRSRFARSARP